MARAKTDRNAAPPPGAIIAIPPGGSVGYYRQRKLLRVGITIIIFGVNLITELFSGIIARAVFEDILFFLFFFLTVRPGIRRYRKPSPSTSPHGKFALNKIEFDAVSFDTSAN